MSMQIQQAELSSKLQLSAGVENGIVNLPTRVQRTFVNASCHYENIANTQ
jgi:hypothetical protein